MTYQDNGTKPLGWDNCQIPKAGPAARLWDFVAKTAVVLELEARKIRHDPIELLTRAIQPALWILVFGQVFTRVRAFPTGDLAYLDFMTPGILAQSVLFVAIFAGMSVIWERDLGIVHKFLASPMPRASLALGKALSAGLRALTQMVIIYLLAFVLGVKINWNPLAILGVGLVVVMGAAAFSTMSLLIAVMVKQRERFLGIGQFMTMPFFFASNAIYPIAIMPAWLQVLANVNPLTYEVDALRDLMIIGGASERGLLVDMAVLFVIAAALVALTSRIYARLAR